MSTKSDAQTVLPVAESSPSYPVLDTLRALGALGVLTTHVAFQTGDYVRHGVIGSLLARFDVGVAIFFVLSGFLLGRPYLARARTGGRPATGRYYWKRWLRIYPLYAVTVVVALVVFAENRREVGVAGWVDSLTLTNTFFARELPQGLTQMWSLAVEASFYLLLPWLMVLLLGRTPHLRPRRVAGWLGGGAILSVWWNAQLSSLLDPIVSGTTALWLPAYLTWFLVGIGLALVSVVTADGTVRSGDGRAHRAVELLISLGRQPGVCWAVAAGVLLIAATPLGGPVLLLVATPEQSVIKHLAYAVVAGLIVLTGTVALPGSRFAAVMSAPLLRHLGHISYSVFCIHLTVLYLVRLTFDHRLFSGQFLVIWACTLLASLLVSEVLYRVLEVPTMRLKDLRRRSPARPSDAATSTPASTAETRY